MQKNIWHQKTWNFQLLLTFYLSNAVVWCTISQYNWGYLSKVTYVLAAEAHTLKMCRIKNNIWYQRHAKTWNFQVLLFMVWTNDQLTNINGALSWGYFSKVTYVLAAEAIAVIRIRRHLWLCTVDKGDHRQRHHQRCNRQNGLQLGHQNQSPDGQKRSMDTA